MWMMKAGFDDEVPGSVRVNDHEKKVYTSQADINQQE
jgi:hypothetical protein